MKLISYLDYLFLTTLAWRKEWLSKVPWQDRSWLIFKNYKWPEEKFQKIPWLFIILVPSGRDPFGQHQESRPLGRFPFSQNSRDFRSEVQWNGKSSGKNIRKFTTTFWAKPTFRKIGMTGKFCSIRPDPVSPRPESTKSTWLPLQRLSKFVLWLLCFVTDTQH